MIETLVVVVAFARIDLAVFLKERRDFAGQFVGVAMNQRLDDLPREGSSEEV